MAAMELSVFRVRLRTLGRIRLDKFPGIPLEGALTAGIREVSCGCRAQDAEDRCPVGRRCAFHLLTRPHASLFESLPRRYGTPPPPLVIRPRFPPGTYEAGVDLEVQAVLVGSAREHFKWLLAGLVAAGRHGVGPTRNGSPRDGRFEVRRIEVVGPERVEEWNGRTVGDACLSAWRYPEDFSAPGSRDASARRLTLELRSPTLVEKKGLPRGSLEFSDLVGALSKRVSVLGLGYGGGNLVPYEEHLRLKALAEPVTLDGRGCRWEEWPRHSRRQGRSFPVGGWVGWVRYRGDFAPFLPLLRLAGLLHVGAHTLMGLGEVSIRTGP